MAFENITLEKGMYGVPGKNFTQVLEELDGSQNYAGTPFAGLDAYQRQLKRFGIRVSGANCDTVEKFFTSSLKVLKRQTAFVFSSARLSLHPYPQNAEKFPSKGKLFKFMSSDVLQCPLMSCDVRRFLFNFRLPLIEEKEEITRINACSQLYKKGGFEPPFQGIYATGFPRLNSPPDCFSLPSWFFVRQ